MPKTAKTLAPVTDNAATGNPSPTEHAASQVERSFETFTAVPKAAVRSLRHGWHLSGDNDGSYLLTHPSTQVCFRGPLGNLRYVLELIRNADSVGLELLARAEGA